MVQINSDWLRELEFFSLLLLIIGFPVLFVSFAVLAWYILLPKSTLPIVVYLLIICSLVFGFSWNTRYNGGGIILMRPFKSYLKHEETDDDRSIARFSIFFVFCLIFVSYGIILIILSL